MTEALPPNDANAVAAMARSNSAMAEELGLLIDGATGTRSIC